jgi:hypothetical protein
MTLHLQRMRLHNRQPCAGCSARFKVDGAGQVLDCCSWKAMLVEGWLLAVSSAVSYYVASGTHSLPSRAFRRILPILPSQPAAIVYPNTMFPLCLNVYGKGPRNQSVQRIDSQTPNHRLSSIHWRHTGRGCCLATLFPCGSFMYLSWVDWWQPVHCVGSQDPLQT